jgi:protein-tyrosine phosphatase
MTDDFNPAVFVYHDHGASQPLPSGDLTPYMMIELPRGNRSLPTQLEIVRRQIEAMAARQLSSPLGSVIGYEFEWRRNISIFLNSKGEFASDSESIKPDKCQEKKRARLETTDRSTRQYVIGYRDGDCCSIAAKKDEQADDEDLTLAHRFYSLADARAAAEQEIANVFEVMKEGGQETLREIMVNLQLAESKPFGGCWKITDRLWAGPSFLAVSPTETEERIRALAAAGIASIVSLINPSDIFLIKQLTEAVRKSGAFPESRFEHSIFPVQDGEAPSKPQMKIMLDVIDGAHLQGKTAYIHCQGGRGRSSTVVGCWMARHGYSIGQGALDDIVELRCASGLFGAAPESESQCRLVRNWNKDE